MTTIAPETESIRADWKVSRVLERYPHLLDVLVEQSPAFRHLLNPLLRSLRTRLVTVGQAARIGGLEPEALVHTLNEAAGLPVPAPEPVATPAERDTADGVLPGTVAEELDVRPLLARGEEPFQAIMAAASRVAPGQGLRLRASFEPVPLYDVLGKRGFQHATRRLAPDDWEVLFTRAAKDQAVSTQSVHATPRDESHEHAASPMADSVLRIDVSDLVPPEPMVRILSAARELAPRQTLLVEHVRRPVYLYPQLDAQGFLHETEEPAPGRVLIRIWRREAAA